MKNRKLKTANDFPIMGYRVRPTVKAELSELMNDLHELYNRSVREDEREVKKNKLFEDALKIGIAALRKKVR